MLQTGFWQLVLRQIEAFPEYAVLRLRRSQNFHMKMQPPNWLCEEAKVIFTKTVEQLGVNAIPSDESVIADFAEAQADVHKLTQVVRFEGETLMGTTGNMYVNPTLNILISRRKDLERLRDDLGLTPHARGVKINSRGKSALAQAMNK